MAKNKLAKFAEMERLENVFQPLHRELLQTEYELKGRWRERVFHNDHPIVLEVGCGKGEYTVGLAECYPLINFIGLDIKGARMWSGATTAIERKLKNVAFIRTHAEMLTSIFAREEISEIWITFPDPQMSKVRKRLTGTRFLNLYRSILTPSGIVHLKTDSPFLYKYTKELILCNELPLFADTNDLCNSDLLDSILKIKTFYEQQWIARGKQIKYIKFAIQGGELKEPKIEIEKDNYRSEARFMS